MSVRIELLSREPLVGTHFAWQLRPRYVPPSKMDPALRSGYTHKQLEYATNTSTVPMEYRQLGGTGLRVSAFSYGTWYARFSSYPLLGVASEVCIAHERWFRITFSYQLGKAPAAELMRAAFAAGINMFDTAEVRL